MRKVVFSVGVLVLLAVVFTAGLNMLRVAPAAGANPNAAIRGVYAGSFRGENVAENTSQGGVFWLRFDGSGLITEGMATIVEENPALSLVRRDQPLAGTYEAHPDGTADLVLETGDPPTNSISLKAVFADNFREMRFVQVGELPGTWSSLTIGEGRKQ